MVIIFIGYRYGERLIGEYIMDLANLKAKWVILYYYDCNNKLTFIFNNIKNNPKKCYYQKLKFRFSSLDPEGMKENTVQILQ